MAKPADLNIRGLLDTLKTLKRFEAMCLNDLLKFTSDDVELFNEYIDKLDLTVLNSLADSIYSQPDRVAVGGINT